MGRKGSGVEVRESSIRVSFVLDGEPCKRTIYINGKPAAPTAQNIKYAHRLASDIRDRIRAETFSMAEFFPASGETGQALTLAAWLETWLGTQRLEASTLAGYSSAVKFWNGASADGGASTLGTVPLRGLKHTQILTAIAARPDLTGKTLNNYASVLREALELAVIEKTLQSNPAAAVPRYKHQRPPPDPFTREEAEAIIDELQARAPEPIGNLVEWWFFTGVRTGEAFGMRWPNVDLASSYVQVSESIVRGVAKASTKTDEARQVLLNSRALAALQRQRKHTQIAGEHVWLDPRYGNAWHEERAFRRSYWTPALKRLGIRYRRPYNMRHTYATMMLMAGMTPAFCAKQLGHSVEIFLRTYAKWLDGGQDRVEMQRLEAALSVGRIACEG